MKRSKSFNAKYKDRLDEVRSNRRTKSARTSETLGSSNTSLALDNLSNADTAKAVKARVGVAAPSLSRHSKNILRWC